MRNSSLIFKLIHQGEINDKDLNNNFNKQINPEIDQFQRIDIIYTQQFQIIDIIYTDIINHNAVKLKIKS